MNILYQRYNPPYLIFGCLQCTLKHQTVVKYIFYFRIYTVRFSQFIMSFTYPRCAPYVVLGTQLYRLMLYAFSFLSNTNFIAIWSLTRCYSNVYHKVFQNYAIQSLTWKVQHWQPRERYFTFNSQMAPYIYIVLTGELWVDVVRCEKFSHVKMGPRWPLSNSIYLGPLLQTWINFNPSIDK